jgi:hypothetical protein
MKRKFSAIHVFAACILPLALASCGTMKVVKAAKNKTSEAMSGLADASIGRFTGPKIPVVEVREKDLRELPSGDQRILAMEAKTKKKRSFWFFGGPVDFKEPSLPTPGAGDETDGSLLPPIE